MTFSARSQHCEVVVHCPGGAILILVYNDIQAPVQAVLHPPMPYATSLKRSPDNAVLSR